MIAVSPAVTDLPLDKLGAIAVFVLLMHAMTLLFAYRVIIRGQGKE